jgi:predicted nucleic acid-binding protein
LQDEPSAAPQVQKLIEQGEREECELFASIINIGEVYYSLVKEIGEERAMEFRNMIFKMPVKIVSATDDEVWQAVNFKKAFPISYADGFAASAALTQKAAIVTGDGEFLTIGQSGPRVLWLGEEREGVDHK